MRVLQNYGIAGSVLTVAALYERRFFAESRSTGGHRPPLQQTKTALRQFCNTLLQRRGISSAEFLCGRLARLYYFGIDIEITRISTAACTAPDAGWRGILFFLSGRRGGCCIR